MDVKYLPLLRNGHGFKNSANETEALINLKLCNSASVGSPGGWPERGGNGDKLGSLQRPTWQTAIRS